MIVFGNSNNVIRQPWQKSQGHWAHWNNLRMRVGKSCHENGRFEQKLRPNNLCVIGHQKQFKTCRKHFCYFLFSFNEISSVILMFSYHFISLTNMQKFFRIFLCLIPSHFWRSQDSYLDSVLFNIYTTPLSSLINSSTISPATICRWRKTFYIFYPKNVSLAIAGLKPIVSLISYCMTPNNLTLNP